MNYKTIITTIQNHVAKIILNRPDNLNSFNLQLGEELFDFLKKISNNKDIKIIIITGQGKGFCGGGDVKEMQQADDKPQYLRKLTIIIHKCVKELRKMEKPVIAAVNGYAFGAGMSFALACDIIIANKNAKFNSAFIGIGLAPGCGTQFFAHVVGYQRACEYILTAKTFSAEEALKLGLINKITDEEMMENELERYINKFKKLPPLAIGKAKMLINKSFENSFEKHLELESLTASESASTYDFNEGVNAFVEKRKPTFKGK